jgi:small subunit ribosomal protein S20
VANHKSAIKRIRTNREQQARNRQWMSRLRTVVKAVRKASTPEEAKAAFEKAVPIIDSTARKGVIHKNAAARHKARLSNVLKALSA